MDEMDSAPSLNSSVHTPLAELRVDLHELSVCGREMPSASSDCDYALFVKDSSENLKSAAASRTFEQKRVQIRHLCRVWAQFSGIVQFWRRLNAARRGVLGRQRERCLDRNRPRSMSKTDGRSASGNQIRGLVEELAAALNPNFHKCRGWLGVVGWRGGWVL